jgi:hypothetical protein
MGSHINFEDNIFILTARIRVIRDLLILDVDPDIFLDKTLTDVDFIDAALGVLLRNLVENTRLIDRNEQFYNLYETEQQFLGTLWDLVNGPGAVSVSSYPVLKDKINILRDHALERRKVIEDHIGAAEVRPSEPVVSSDELNELLREF